jgi:hypothetical protein
VITNTKFTDAATKYATCAGIELLSWEFPRNNSLHDLIEKYKVYPLTVLTRMTQGHKQALMSQGAILCSDILKAPERLTHANILGQKASAILGEAEQLCGSK